MVDHGRDKARQHLYQDSTPCVGPEEAALDEVENRVRHRGAHAHGVVRLARIAARVVSTRLEQSEQLRAPPLMVCEQRVVPGLSHRGGEHERAGNLLGSCLARTEQAVEGVNPLLVHGL